MEPAFSVCRTSDVYIGPAARLLPDLVPEGRVIAVTDDEVYRCHGELLAPFETLRIGRGERCKTLSTVEELCRRLIAAGADRKTFILGVGGGIVTDVAGFAAATYMRGVGFGFVSTTLLGQVDASVGGKNGVNVAGYKNMVGTFTQPRFVVCDPSLLATLPTGSSGRAGRRRSRRRSSATGRSSSCSNGARSGSCAGMPGCWGASSSRRSGSRLRSSGVTSTRRANGANSIWGTRWRMPSRSARIG